ncbi:MAG: VWA domain-containing protein, partial [Epsilonproteobacteria bacterium]|nr:VWA domain-containing protein [Campylobacterota bacterium]
MSFEYPYLFWILIVPFLIFAFLILTNKESVERVFSKDILERLSVDRGGLPNRLRSLIMLSAIFFDVSN